MILLIKIFSLSIICTTLILGLIILLHDYRKRVNQIFAIIVISSAFWVFSNLMVDTVKTDYWLIIWSKLTILGPIIIASSFLYFSYIFPIYSKIKKYKILLIFTPIILLFLIPTHFNIENANILPDGTPQVIPGVLYVPFFAYFGIYIAIGIYIFIKNLKKSVAVEKKQIQYVILGTIIAVSIGLISNVILLSIGIQESSSIGPLGTIFWTGFISLAILKHHLLNIKVIATELFTGLLIILLFINIFSYASAGQMFLNIGLFIGASIIGILLIKSVLNEVRQREKLEGLTLQLREANVQLKKLDQAKSEFLSIASHQLRTPLTAIKGYLSMVLEGTYGKISKKVEKPINNVFQASKQLNQLVNTLLNVSRIEAGKIKLEAIPTPIKEILEPISEQFKIVAEEKGLYLKLAISDPLPLIPLDKEKINQVIMNIIDNAIKYTEKGGITVKCKMENGKLKITISDTGLGMDKEQLGEIFQKFNRGAAGETHWVSGAGLGLYIAKEFTELHKGKVWAESEGSGKGSIFNIELPVISSTM